MAGMSIGDNDDEGNRHLLLVSVRPWNGDKLNVADPQKLSGLACFHPA